MESYSAMLQAEERAGGYSVTLSSSIGYVVETPDARLGRDVGRRQRKHRKSDSGVLEFHPPPLSSYQ
jgi:hypothetical protein